jgi:hypothetical protein
MLSWVLATASPTPTAPASQSKTMVTGRVCKSLMARFSSNGSGETLEVKLKLVPVPSCSKNEFLQNMAAYRNPNVVMPEGFDNHAWNSFLQAIPNAGTLDSQSQMPQGQPFGMRGTEQLHDMLTPNLGPDEDAYSARHSVQGSRTGSPTPSHLSAGNQQPIGYNQSRPTSRMSMHQQNDFAVDDQTFEDGPSKKRARLTQAEWNGRGSFGATADSLRVAVSTSSSLRNFRPSAVGNSSAGNDMLPRAPTPRPGEKRHGRLSRPPTLSGLRRESSSYTTPYPPSEPGLSRMDSGIYSLGDDEASSRYGSPSPDIPSSPPEYTPVDGSMPPSSPGLPELPYLPDSGFQSDAVIEAVIPQKQLGNRHNQRQRKGQIEWLEVQPGPREALPTEFQDFDPLSRRNAHPYLAPSSPTMKPKNTNRGGRAKSRVVPPPPSGENEVRPIPDDITSPNGGNILPSTEGSIEQQSLPQSKYPNSTHPHSTLSMEPTSFVPRPLSRNNTYPNSGPQPPPIDGQALLPANPLLQSEQAREASQGPAASSIVLPQKNAKRGPRPPGSRVQSWTAVANSSDVDSDSAMGGRSKSRFRNGSGVVRLKTITTQLEESVRTGQPVKHCRNCGEIKTPTWRPYWTRVHDGDANDVNVNDLCGIHMFETLEKNDEGKTTKYRVYKQLSHLTQVDKEQSLYEQYIFCNRKSL